MKLLLDENLSDRIAARIADLFPNSSHVKSEGLIHADDARIWEFAGLNGFTLVSKDADFHQRSLLFGHPPRLVFLRTGNCSTETVVELLRRNAILIAEFHEDAVAAILIPTNALVRSPIAMLYPILFQPIFKERIWGGRQLEALYQKQLPAGVPIGESWEISDRPGDVSVIANGVFAGKTLRWLLEEHATAVYGDMAAKPKTFPLLVKILDAQQDLSLQVHPPASKASEMGGEPKTEMWYFTKTTPEAKLYVGLRRGVTRGEFEQRIGDGSVAECFHKIQVRAGDSMFLPSGRVHALGAGSVLFEIQQNSDTTYRVFDWNRVDASGKPRELHVAQSLESIDFEDFEPALASAECRKAGQATLRPLVDDPLFAVRAWDLPAGEAVAFPLISFQIIGLVSGEATIKGNEISVTLKPGQFALLPAGLHVAEVKASKDARFLQVSAGRGTPMAASR